MQRLALILCVTCLALIPFGASAQTKLERQFQSWIAKEFWLKANASGVSSRTYKRTMGNASLNLKLPGLVLPGTTRKKQVQSQAEFRSPARYFDESRMRGLANIGRQLAKKHKTTLARIEKRYGVPSGIIIAIWGRESGFGRAAITNSVIDVLATMSYLSPRKEFFQAELIAALKIVQSGQVPTSLMKSSWAGAMGQPQFMPSSYLNYAVDFDGDGKKDIWNSVPDSLASIANYLAKSGWISGRDWGFESVLPGNANCAREGPDNAKAIALWNGEGIARINKRPFPSEELPQAGMLILPAGTLGPEFIVTPNFYVIKEYNKSDLYALFIGNLADRITWGMGSFKAKWQKSEVMLRSDIRTIQERLERKGYDVGGADGLPGYKTRRSIGDWQAKNGIRQTCFPNKQLLKQIR